MTGRPAHRADSANPWQGGHHGEVRGPSGRRCYTPERAGELGRRGPKWAKKLPVEKDRETTGHRRVFLLADSFEQYLETLGLWPPEEDAALYQFPAPAEAVDQPSGSEIDKLKRTLGDVQSERDRLARELATARQEIAELNRMVADYSRMLARRAGR